jgi:hypothetical protein
MNSEIEPQPSQASSHFPLEAVSGETLFETESTRRSELDRKGTLRTGCRELDDCVLLGGLGRGSVVGVSAEEMDVGLLVRLWIISGVGCILDHTFSWLGLCGVSC